MSLQKEFKDKIAETLNYEKQKYGQVKKIFVRGDGTVDETTRRCLSELCRISAALNELVVICCISFQRRGDSREIGVSLRTIIRKVNLAYL